MVLIRKIRKDEFGEAAEVISKTFLKCNKNECSSENTLKDFLKYYCKDNGKEHMDYLFLNAPICFVAIEKNKIVGVIRGTLSRIINLFVLNKFQNKGIGKKLVMAFEEEAKKKKSKKIVVRSSINAIIFYQKRGYKKTRGISMFKGIKTQPMKKVI